MAKNKCMFQNIKSSIVFIDKKIPTVKKIIKIAAILAPFMSGMCKNIYKLNKRQKYIFIAYAGCAISILKRNFFVFIFFN